MNCWRSFNLFKDLGSIRLVILSLLGMVCFFVIFNLTFIDLFGQLKIENFNILLFILSLLLVLPLHKLFHCIPLWLTRKKARLTIDRSTFIPTLHCDISGAIPKRLYMIVIMFPVVFISAALFFLTVFVPSGVHYFSMAGSLNFGFSISDFLYLSYMISAPAHAFIEDDRDGCRILIRQLI